jgi:hypothetical protein
LQSRFDAAAFANGNLGEQQVDASIALIWPRSSFWTMWSSVSSARGIRKPTRRFRMRLIGAAGSASPLMPGGEGFARVAPTRTADGRTATWPWSPRVGRSGLAIYNGTWRSLSAAKPERSLHCGLPSRLVPLRYFEWRLRPYSARPRQPTPCARCRRPAWRRGHRYGTTFVNLECNQVLDLLPDRQAETLAAWRGVGPYSVSPA